MSQLVLGLGSVRQCGKDTLCVRLNELDNRFTRYAFADPLREDLAPFLWKHFTIDIWNCSAEDKELVRPILIAYGMVQRARDPDYWVKRTLDQVVLDLAQAKTMGLELIPVIVDMRFENEPAAFKETFPDFRLINMSRIGGPPPTEEEEKHYRKVAALADYQFKWGNDTYEEQLQRAEEVIRWLEVGKLV